AAAAKSLPSGGPEKSAADARANALRAQAADLRAAAEKVAAEAAALRKGVAAAGGQALPAELRDAADALRNNRQAEGANRQRSAAARLDELVKTLTEKEPEAAPDLAKWKPLADELNALADAQDDL